MVICVPFLFKIIPSIIKFLQHKIKWKFAQFMYAANLQFRGGFWKCIPIPSHRSSLAVERVVSCRDLVKTFSSWVPFEQKVQTCKSLVNRDILVKSPYLTDMFGNVNKLNLTLDSRQKQLHNTNKVMVFTRKMEFWTVQVQQITMDGYFSINDKLSCSTVRHSRHD
jgi:hypothetical protein